MDAELSALARRATRILEGRVGIGRTRNERRALPEPLGGGIASSTSRDTVVCWRALERSTTGVSPKQ